MLDRGGAACRRAPKPLILIQNTGMMESGDSIRGWLHRAACAGRADGRLSRLDAAWREHRYRGDLHRTVPDAFDLNYYLVESDADAPRISIAFEEAEHTQRPVVVLVGDEYHGFNR